MSARGLMALSGDRSRIDLYFYYKPFLNAPLLLLMLGCAIYAPYRSTSLTLAALTALDWAIIYPLAYIYRRRQTGLPFVISASLTFILTCGALVFYGSTLSSLTIYPLSAVLLGSWVLRYRRRVAIVFIIAGAALTALWLLEAAGVIGANHEIIFRFPFFVAFSNILSLFILWFVTDSFIRSINWEKNRRGDLYSEIDEMDEHLRSVEGRFSMLFENSAEALFLLDDNGIILACNGRAEKVLRNRRDLIEGKKLLSVLGPLTDEADTIYKMIRQSSELEGPGDVQKTIELQFYGGDRVYLNFISMPVYFDESAGGYLLIGHDHTETEKLRQQAEDYSSRLEILLERKARDLDRSRNDYIALFNQIADLIFTLDPKGRFVEINRAAAGLLGLSSDQAAGSNWLALFDENDQAFARDAIKEVFAGKDNIFELGCLRPKGGFAIYQFRAQPAKTEDDENIISIIARDISELKEVENRLRESTERYRSIFNNAQVGLFRTNIETGRLMEANSTMAAIAGYDSVEKYVAEHLPASSYVEKDVYGKAISVLMKTGRVENFEAEIFRADRSTVWISFSAKAFPDQGYIEGVAADISARKRAEQEVGERERLLADLFEQSPDAIQRTTPEGPVLDLNPAALKMFGYKPEDRESLKGKLDISEHWADPSLRKHFVDLVEKEGYLKNYEVKFRRLDGTYFFGLATTLPRMDVSGKIIEYQNIIKDISDRKQLEQTLRTQSESLENKVAERTEQLIEHQKRIEEILDSSPDAIYEHDLSGKILYVNRRACELTGWGREELIGKRINEIWVTENPGESQTMLTAIKMSGRVRNYEIQIKNKFGGEIIVEVNADIYNRGGDTYIRGTARDVGEKIRLDSERREAERKYSDLFETANDAIYLLDREGNFTAINPAGEKIIGYSSSELVGVSFLKMPFFDAEQRTEIVVWLERVIAGVQAAPTELRIRRKDGTYRYLETRSAPMYSGDEIIGVQGIARDVTDRKMLELQRIRMLEELEQRVADRTEQLQSAYAELKDKNEKLQSLDQLKTNLLQNVSHELRTPLVAIKGYTELMLAEKIGSLSDKQRNFLQTVYHNSNQLVRLISDLLDFSRLDQGAEKLDLAEVDVADIVRTSVENIAPAMAEKGGRIELDIDAEDLRLIADPRRLIQIVGNLLSNALKFASDEEPIIVAAVVRLSSTVKIIVSDNGIGIPADKLDKVFDRFFQADDSATRGHGGTGIGLAIVKELVDLHQGEISVESENGEGATFIVELPAPYRPDLTAS